MEQTIGQPVGQTGTRRTLNIKKDDKEIIIDINIIGKFCPGNPGAGLVP